MAATIGIKIANGEFYSIVSENSNIKKRLVLTTVHDKQRSVQIDLYKSYTKTMADALYIGSLVVEDIREKPKGEPSIEMIISCDEEGHISAEALDLDTGSGGQHQYLNVSLKSLDEDNRDLDLPDFELEQQEAPPQGLYERANAIKGKKEEKKRGKWLWPLVILLGILVIAACLALFFFFVNGKAILGQIKTRSETSVPEVRSAQPETQEELPPVQSAPAQQSPAQPEAPVQTPAPPKAETPKQTPPVIQAPAQPRPVERVSRKRNPPVASYKVPATIPKNGVAYKIRWGDTLWDIAAAFYRNPWLYPRIARYNGIKNPDLIISGKTIRIPPKN
ncbi:MAG: LysM peptidoglycan-binding domain-containing protein [Treponema sp.]|nr:LysM peptidoglycan-binding domain-containing protein [Treponema sp.]